MKFAQIIYTGKLSFENAEKEQNEILTKIKELEIRSESKCSCLKDENRNKMKLVAKNARELYNFRNEIINTIKKEIREETAKDKKIKKLKLHRPEEELIELITNIEEDTDLKNEFYPNNARIKLLEFLNKVINKKLIVKKKQKKFM